MRKILILMLFMAMAAYAAAANAAVTVSYDKFEDIEQYETSQIYGNFHNPIYVYASAFIHRDGEPTHPIIMFKHQFYGGVNYFWTRFYEVIILADGQRYTPLGSDRDTFFTSNTEIVYSEFSKEDYLKIARAQTIEVKVGAYEFTLTDKMRNELALLADKLQPNEQPSGINQQPAKADSLPPLVDPNMQSEMNQMDAEAKRAHE